MRCGSHRVGIGAGILLLFVVTYVLIVGFHGVPGRLHILNVMSVLAALSAVTTAALAAGKSKDTSVRRYWGFLAAAYICLMVAETLSAVDQAFLHVTRLHPSPADYAWLAFYPLASIALASLTRRRRDRLISETISVLDAVLLSTAGAGLSWEFLMLPGLHPDAGSLVNIGRIAYPIGDLLLLGALASLALSSARRAVPRGTPWVIASLVVLFVADAAVTRTPNADAYVSGTWIDPLWPLSYTLVALGALVYLGDQNQRHAIARTVPVKFARVGSVAKTAIHRYSPYGAVLAAGLLSYAHFVLKGGSGPVADTIVVLVTTFIPIIVLARQHLVSVENSRLHKSLLEASLELEDRVHERTQELADEKKRLDVLNYAAKEISNCASIGELLSVGSQLLARAKHGASVAASAPGSRGGLHFACTSDLSDGAEREMRKTLRKFLLSNAANSDPTPVVLCTPGDPHTGIGLTSTQPGVFTSMIVFPIVSKQVMLGAGCVAWNASDCSLTQSESDLIGNIISQLAVALEGVCRYDDARFLADNDALTGLPNRRTISERLEQEVARSERTGASFALVVMDLDSFKDVNDTYGHATGDRVLIATARALGEAVRVEDIIGRFGGDEFVAILPNTEYSGARFVMERIVTSLADHPVRVDRAPAVQLRLSCGLAVYPTDGHQSQELFHVADADMYREKRRHAAQLVGASALGAEDDTAEGHPVQPTPTVA